MTNWKKVDAAVDAAFRRLQLGQLPHCGAKAGKAFIASNNFPIS